ncbi:MFS transporter [Candidatus Roizmanbacteria bacterium RIFCSPHIGHO2_12_FULL_33_9]|uniref:MFS transporter n=1 Tax=Candidatus Roizmanbacteria bacterium RIFCSPHIGHO2_12_FULL_33_9 TaxID=1802045 RepID=A0A1F7HJN6_9BACT|nr:MAG: MFS transporter [Candidatus Roizmanbacteria bacterium RIFCSPHIGHO2_12_FULL_33_9]
MLKEPRSIQSVYLYLILGNTLAASFIWGINTLFLLDAGLTNFQAFAANAFFTLGQVIFEIPTGIVADTFGRRKSYLLGALTLGVSTLLYLYMWQIKGPFWGWAASSMLLGLGFTFFSGALEAWLVDALDATGFKGSLDGVFAKGQIVGGSAMLIGSIAGGVIAQFTNLGVPYILRALILGINFATAFFLMKDLGFTPERSPHPLNDMKKIFGNSIEYGLKNPPVRWLMIAAPFTIGVSFYIFYALQPFLLQLYGDSKAYAIAGLAAALAASAQIAGGFTTTFIRKLFSTRTSALFLGIFFTGLVLIAVGLVNSFWLALILIFIWGLIFAALSPMRQTYLNGIIPSRQRATVLSFDNLMGSSGGIFIQPALGRAADLWSYSTSYVFAAFIQLAALPFVYLAKKQKAKSDEIKKD